MRRSKKPRIRASLEQSRAAYYGRWMSAAGRGRTHDYSGRRTDVSLEAG
jgi:CDP-diacylglycerol pyrophosphatase